MTGRLIETVVADGVVVWTLGGETMATSYGTNCVAVWDRGAALLVDPLIAPAYAREVEQALRTHTDALVRFVVLTHHHTDHTWGAGHFAAQGAAVVAHRACRERMAAEHPALLSRRRQDPALADLFADVALVLPTVAYDAALVLHAGDVEVELWHAGWGHTPGDTFLFVPDRRVAICGDLVFAGYHYNYENASVPGVRQGLRALAALDADVFIPGHGAPGGADLLQQQQTYHDTVEQIVVAGLGAGQDANTIAAQITAAFPGNHLGLVVPSAVEAFTKQRTQS